MNQTLSAPKPTIYPYEPARMVRAAWATPDAAVNPSEDAALLERLRRIGTASPEIKRLFELAARAIAAGAAQVGWASECQWLRRNRLHLAADEIQRCHEKIAQLEGKAPPAQTLAQLLPKEEKRDTAWREIASAPKDGSRIELYRPKNGAVFGKWDENKHATRPQPYWTNDQERVWGTQAVRADQPTHWRPLSPPPAPPAALAKASRH